MGFDEDEAPFPGGGRRARAALANAEVVVGWELGLSGTTVLNIDAEVADLVFTVERAGRVEG